MVSTLRASLFKRIHLIFSNAKNAKSSGLFPAFFRILVRACADECRKKGGKITFSGIFQPGEQIDKATLFRFRALVYV